MFVESVNINHLGSWAHLRNALWPRMSASEHERDIQTTFFGNAQSTAAFVAIGGGELIGFAEASLRHDYVNGCETSPVAFLEGIYVAAANRRQGVAKALCAAVEDWGRNQGCVEFASDTSLDNDVSQLPHAALGFEETQRVVFFRKRNSWAHFNWIQSTGDALRSLKSCLAQFCASRDAQFAAPRKQAFAGALYLLSKRRGLVAQLDRAQDS